MADRKPSDQYLWQKMRLRPAPERVPGASIISGYGPDGSYGMLIPSAKVERKFVFHEGKPQVEIVGSCLSDPKISSLRDRVLRGRVSDSALAILFVDTSLIEYSAALLAMNYVLTDEDLTFLHSGKKWHNPLIVHAMGGDDNVKALASFSKERLRMVNEAAQGRYNGIIRTFIAPAGAAPSPALPAAPVDVAAEVEKIVDAGEALDLASD